MKDKNEIKPKDNNPLLYRGDEHLFQVVKKNEMNITQKFINK